MPQPFVLKANVTNAVKNIVDHYALIDGPIRELLQNSDDAGATIQTFVLDHRHHSISSVINPEYISSQQSPALIACNDAYFEHDDWASLQSIFDSSKVDDPTAFGQFGQGFRCVYHLSECPQIFSGNKLALLNLPDGTILDMTDSSDASCTSHIAAFQGLPRISCSPYVPVQPTNPQFGTHSNSHVTDTNVKGKAKQDSPRMEGTAIRLPLRSRPSPLSTQCPKPEEILKLFDEFTHHDLECVLLFLKNVKEIAIYEIKPDGYTQEICWASIQDRGPRVVGDSATSRGARKEAGRNYKAWRTVIETRVTTGSRQRPRYPNPGTSSGIAIGNTAPVSGTTIVKTKTIWRLLDCPFTDTSSAAILEKLSKEHNPEEEMKRRKLHQRIQAAAPLSIVTSTDSSVPSVPVTSFTPSPRSSVDTHASWADNLATSAGSPGLNHWRNGRLFSGLPLPRFNNRSWPIHIDARFAIPPSRQFIRSSLEGGFVGEWNVTLFTAFIPQAWTFLLNVLAHEDKVKDIFAYWPPPGPANDHMAPITHAAYAGINPNFVSGRSTSLSSGSAKSQGMLQTVFDCVTVAKAAVWPIYVPTYPTLPTSISQSHLAPNLTSPSPPVSPQFADLGTLKVARDDLHLELRNTLAECGVQFTKPPPHFNTLIEGSSSGKFEFLEPRNVYEDLLVHGSSLEKAISMTEKHATNLIDFFLKGQDINLLAGFPLLKNVDGQFITLQRLRKSGLADSAKQTMHILFDTRSTALFKAYDSNAIGIQELKHAQAAFIQKNAPGVLNVAELTAEKVTDYLSMDSRWTSLTSPTLPLLSATSSPPITREILQWLTKFYSWLLDQSFSSNTLRIMEDRQLCLIPTQLGLRQVGSIVFDSMGLSSALGKCLRSLGVPLLDPAIGPAARRLMSTGNCLTKVEDIHHIIAASRTEPLTNLTCKEWRELIDHIVRCTLTEQNLIQDHIKKLRSLPIYPIISFADLSDMAPKSSPGAIPEGKTTYAVTDIEILPIIDGCVMLDFRGWPSRLYEIIRILDPSSSDNVHPLTPIKLLQLGVQNFGSQPPELRSSIVNYAANNEGNVPRECLERLLTTPFVVCRDGVIRQPGEVVDPMSSNILSDIVSTCLSTSESAAPFDNYLPRMEGDSDKQILDGLRKLRISPFRTALDQSLTLKITSWISSNGNHPDVVSTSRKLFNILASKPVYAEFVTAIPSDAKWIATNFGLKSRQECRDRNAHSAIFDELYALVDDEIQVTDALRNCLGWSEKISLDELFSQFDATLQKEERSYARVRDIIQLIASETIPESDLARLRTILGRRPWVPTKTGGLVKHEDAVLSGGISGSGIFEVSFDGVAYPRVVELLRRIGIAERPTVNMILTRIEGHKMSRLNASRVGNIIKLLEALPDDLDEESRTRIYLPDVDCNMRPISELYFNDTGTQITQLPLGEKAIAHSLLPEQLARQLGLEPLANHYSRFSGYMGESFSTSIRNAIAEYTETQTLVEMLANAVDAGAKRFILILDEMSQSTQHLISPGLRTFQQCPALLVFNDARFTEEDFEGLCNTGEGSKKWKDNTIGQFGRGALTMFQFTECPTLISKNTAMFMDPTRMHLSDLPSNTNNQRMETRQLQRFYPSHLNFLATLANILGFEDKDIGSFDGTIFRLPLRTEEHINHASPISDTIWSPLDIREKIFPAFKDLARNCFLFTGLEWIQVYTRDPEGVLRELWQYEALRTNIETDGEFKRSMIQITEGELQRELWQTASLTISQSNIPPFASALIHQQRTRRLKYPKVALAAHIRPDDADYEDYHRPSCLFSTLPLTEPTGLPIYCSGTFVTSSDRRHVRLQLDNDAGNQARFNEWLLKDMVPQVYLYLLEVLLATGVPNHHFWPVNRRTAVDKIVIDALYEDHLKITNRRLFQSAFNAERRLTPEEVVILDKGSTIRPIIEFLAPHNVAIYSEPFLSCITDDAQLRPVSPQFVKEQISRDPTGFLSGFSASGEQPRLFIDDLSKLLLFFLDHDPDQLVGLPLLPLEDGDFGTFAQRSESITYYVWRHQLIPNKIFANPNRLVMLDVDADMLLSRGFNVEELSSSSLAELIAERFPRRPSVDVDQDPDAKQFIQEFWANFDHLQMRVDDILDFPLVPKLLTNEYISLGSCQFGDVPIVPNRVDHLVCQCLANLGVPIVRLSSSNFPPPLLRILDDRTFFTEFKMKDILQALGNVNPAVLITSFFQELSERDREMFSDWVRRQLFLDVPDDLRDAARTLPVWMARDNTGVHNYIPASQVVLLPETLDEGIVVPYMTGEHKIVLIPQGQNHILRPALKSKLRVDELSFHELLRIISSGLPLAMPYQNERLSYKRLVEAILERIEPPLDALTELKLPNAADFSLQPVQDFYAREECLFRAAYPETSSKFLSPEFQDMEGRLPQLKRTGDLTMEIFADCAQLIAESGDVNGATTAFNLMNDRLPLLLSALGPDADRWELIEDIPFIPRLSRPLERRTTDRGESAGLDVSWYRHQQFGVLVAPRAIVRDEYEAVAWSQRAIPDRSLNEGLLRAYPAFGRPTAPEVIDHLRILATRVSHDHPNHPALLSDIVATYRHLNERAEECAVQLAALMDEPLFLNVDDPQEPGVLWKWDSASVISFDILDVGNFRSARRFLQRYRPLLVAAGAQEVNHLPSSRSASGAPSSDPLARIRSRFAEMREKEYLVDVSIVTRDDEAGHRLLGHRSFLATHSDRLMTIFCNDTGMRDPELPSHLMQIDASDYSRSCVSLILDYVYTGSVAVSVSLSDLLDGLGLATDWEMADIVEMLQDCIIERHWLNPNTLNEIERVAIQGAFNKLIGHCHEYRTENNQYITRATR